MAMNWKEKAGSLQYIGFLRGMQPVSAIAEPERLRGGRVTAKCLLRRRFAAALIARIKLAGVFRTAEPAG